MAISLTPSSERNKQLVLSALRMFHDSLLFCFASVRSARFMAQRSGVGTPRIRQTCRSGPGSVNSPGVKPITSSQRNMSRARLLKFVIFCHRWLGVTWCLLFALWFTSGIVMMYWSFPEVEVADRLRRAPALDASHIQVSPQDAYARLQLA